jgi:hypothetical protein
VEERRLRFSRAEVPLDARARTDKICWISGFYNPDQRCF